VEFCNRVHKNLVDKCYTKVLHKGECGSAIVLFL
jgi:hypothetical protein